MVDIEDRLPRFSPDATLPAWRLFRLRAEGKRLVLSSPMYHDDTTGLMDGVSLDLDLARLNLSGQGNRG